MQKETIRAFHQGTVAAIGALVLASCAARQPAQTTINVNVPATTESSSANETADLRTSNDVSSPASIAKSERTKAREDPIPAKKSATSRKTKSQLLDFYDRLPAENFAAFGGVNRRSLLGRKGAIVDYQHNFIDIPGSSDERDGDLERLQITLFPNGNEPWCAVSRIVWPQGQTPGALNFYYGESDSFDRRPRLAAAGFFPYKLRKTDMGYESAWLPQRGLDIRINSAQDAELNGPIFHYNRNFRVGEPAFKQIYESQEG